MNNDLEPRIIELESIISYQDQMLKDLNGVIIQQQKHLDELDKEQMKEVRKDYAQYAQEEIPKLNEIYKKDKKGATDAFIDLMANQKKGAEKVKIALQGLSHPDQMDLMDAVNKNLITQLWRMLSKTKFI